MSDTYSLDDIIVDFAVLTSKEDFDEFIEGIPSCTVYFYKTSIDDEWDLTCQEICDANPNAVVGCVDIDHVSGGVPSNIANGGFAHYEDGKMTKELPKELKL